MLRTLSHSTPALFALFLGGCGDAAGPRPGDDPLVMAVGGQHACHANESATHCWGKGTDGQLGIGITLADTTPVALSSVPAFITLAAGSAHTCGLDAEGRAYCWGSNEDGQLGTSVPVEQCPLPCAVTPRPVAGDLRFGVIAAGTKHTCGVTAGGTVYCWGLNDVGQLGTTAASESCVDGPCSRVPMPVVGGNDFTTVTAGIYHTCGLKTDGAAYCWGFQVGTTEKVHTIPQFSPDVKPMTGNLAFRQISAGGMHTCGLTGPGIAYCWGIDALGAGPTPLESDVPVAVGGRHRFSSIYSATRTSCGIEANGAAFCWGPNSHGEVGAGPIGSTVRFDLPSPVSGGLRFSALRAGHSTYCGMTIEEDIVCWGRGSSGELGSGHEDSTLPVPVPGL